MLPALTALVAFGLVVLLYAVFVERNWFALRVHRIPCLPPGARPISVLHVSDLHLRAGQRWKRRWLRRLARLEPDLVVGTGDFLGDQRSVDATVEAMDALRARRARIFVLGSNDYYSPRFKNPLQYFAKHRERRPQGTSNPWRELVDALEARGWTFLNNRSSSVGDIEMAGLDDAHIGRADLRAAGARAREGFRLAVTHSPDVAGPLADLGYDLIVCGHTHGGQVCVPGFGALITNSALPRAMAKGVHRLGEAWLHVCAGLGTSMYAPYRLACRPEACLLELVPREEEGGASVREV